MAKSGKQVALSTLPQIRHNSRLPSKIDRLIWELYGITEQATLLCPHVVVDCCQDPHLSTLFINYRSLNVSKPVEIFPGVGASRLSRLLH